MMDQETKQILHQLSDILNDNLDKMIKKRVNAAPQDIRDYRYVCKKLEISIGSINKAIDRVNATV